MMLNMLVGPGWEVPKSEMKDYRSVGVFCLELPRGMEERASEASRSDGGVEPERPVESDGLQPGGRGGGVDEALLVLSVERVERSTGATIDQSLVVAVLF
jgi:hypothetical protein